MIDLNKSLEYFDPSTVKGTINIVGCGAVGSHVAVLLARLGLTDFTLWDEDTVASHNIANQNFTFKDIGRPKTEVVAETIQAINPEAKVTIKGFATDENHPKGIVVMCVDSIAVRKLIVHHLRLTPGFNQVFDFRMGLTSGQFYSADTVTLKEFEGTMNFTDEEADKYTPKSACNFELSVAYSIWSMLGVGVSLMVRRWKGEQIPMTTIIDTGNLSILSV